jgi:hypothetical protein
MLAPACRARRRPETEEKRVTTTAAGAADGGWRALTVTGEAAGAGVVPIRPLTLGDLLDEPFVLLRAHLRAIVLFAAAAVVPSQLLQGYLSREALAGFDLGLFTGDPEALTAALTADGGGAATFLISALNGLLLLPIAVGLVSRLAVSSLLGEHLDDRTVVRATFARLPALAGTWFLAALVVVAVPLLGVLLAVTAEPLAGGFLTLLGLPVALIAFVLLAPAPLVAVVERRPPLAALRRSVRLVRPRFWAVAAALVLALGVSSLVQLALAGLPSALAFVLPGDAAWIVASAGSTLAGLVATPYTMLVVVLVYVDALVRGEALDVRRLLDPPGRTRHG